MKNIKSIHFVGIKGVAMTALAILAKESGRQVTGSDLGQEFPTDVTLKRFGIIPQKDFYPGHLPKKIDLVIYTGAHQGINNIEVQEALSRDVPVLPHGKALAYFMDGKQGITVAGSHGKTTTSAMIAHLLTEIGQDPSFAIGCGEILSLKSSGHSGKGKLFVAEGDEYATDPMNDQTPRFMWQNPDVLVITNIDFDHPDVYKDLNTVKQAFIDFANSLSQTSTVVLNVDNEITASIIPYLKPQILTYGESKSADVRICSVSLNDGVSEFVVLYPKKEKVTFYLKVPGYHNVQNATAAIASLVILGFDLKKLIKPLLSFIGTKRRFEHIGEKNGKLLYDDYAHHPAEIEATLKASRDRFPQKRIIVIFQPHTYSRTLSLLGRFAGSFSNADLVILSEIYASAREKHLPGVSSQLLYAEMKKRHPDVHLAPKKNDVLKWLKTYSKPNDLILTMGAGDIFNWLSDILNVF